ncbi:MAG TPA: HAD-IIIA family hydrolase [Lacunisphaera sp.]|jgi:histidinol-phosphate phosphatase family protein
MSVTQAIILCGGKGTRLGERVRTIPKPLIPVGGRPVLDYIMDILERAGINRFILAAGYLGQVIEELYKRQPRPGCTIHVEIESAPLGTAGAIRLLSDQLDDNFAVAYGDIFVDFDLQPMIEQHTQLGPLGTLLVRASDHPWDSHLIDEDNTGRVREFIHEHQPGRSYRNLANAAFYLLSKKIVAAIPVDQPIDFGSDIFPLVLREGGELRTYHLPEESFVKDMGTPERLAAVEQYLVERAMARAAAAFPKPVRTVLLDRDGVLNIDHDLIDRIERLEILPGAPEAIALFNRAGINCYVITNQPVVARGLCTEDTLKNIHAHLMEGLAKAGGKIEAIYYCPHHPETHHAEGIARLRRACRCRKPSPGLIFQAQGDHRFDLASAVMVGDRSTDVRAGHAAGLRTVLVGEEKKRRKEAASAQPTAEFTSLLAFAQAITQDARFT